ncbi:Fic family protein [Bdellovibrio sp.]|uniref:Fic family protein n=1 Tax=Bdellovibrio TaxID=958 RepID=UPI0032217354
MGSKDEFEFLNSELWLKYTQDSYRSPEEIKYRLEKVGVASSNWVETKNKIMRFRKVGAIPLFLKSIDKKFWFYPADCIYKKAHEIEKLGLALHEKINKESAFASDFLVNATIEEAITSAIYEGANSTRAKAKELIEKQTPPKNKDEWMLLNNYKALMWIKENHSAPVSEKLINDIHAIVTKNTLTEDDINFSGKYRNDKVFVTSGREIRHEGVEYTKLGEVVPEAIELVTKSPRYFPSLLKGILLHYFISYIHPYFDGNGRTARTLFYYKAIKNDLKFVELLSVSAYLKNHGKQYERSFEKVVQNDLDITYFIDFNLDALEEALKKVAEKVDFLVKIKSIQEGLELSDQQIGLLQKLALHRFRSYDIESYADSIGKSREIARQELKKLADVGLLDESREGKKFVYKIMKENLERMLA